MLDYPLKEEFFGKKSMLGYQVTRPKALEKKEGDKYQNYDKGTIFLSAAPVLEGQTKKFNWDARILIALTRQEISDIADLATKPADTELKLFHDPGKGGPTEGQKVTSVSVKIAESTVVKGAKAFLFNFYQKVQGAEKKVSVVLSENQMRLLAKDFTQALGVTIGVL